MAAYEIPNLRFSAEAGAAIERRRFVTFNDQEQAVHAAAGTKPVGVSSLPAGKDEVAEIYDGIVMVEAGGAIKAGEQVEVGANAKAVKLASGAVAGIAVTNAGAAGELLSIKL